LCDAEGKKGLEEIMHSVSTAHFCKLKTCPSAEHLLAFHTGSLTLEEELATRNHLALCDFCAAETALLAKCPPEKDFPCHSVEIPASLHLLAKTLLKSASSQRGSRSESLFERERLTLTDA
jgi:hypothetical protein